MQQSDRPSIGTSACLLGQPVRFDGGHKNQPWLAELSGKFFDFVPLCPEMEAGFGNLRPAIQLRKVDNEVRLVFSKAPHQDLTERMNRYSAQRVETLGELDGFIFKKNSPSCGMSRVAVIINDDGYRERSASGLFAAAFMQRWPLIPVEDEGRLNDAAIRENFFERVFAYRRWKAISSPHSNVQGLFQFHANHKLQLMARGSHFYQELGRLVAGTTRHSLAEKRVAYIERFMEVMINRPRPGQHVNVLQHIQGYLKNSIGRDDKMELAQLFEAFRQRQLPLITPITMLRHHLRNHPDSYLAQQHYLAPFPDALALRAVI